jgi:hypothetical protein
MSLKLNSSGGGSVTLQEPSTASNLTVTLPTTTGTAVIQNASNNLLMNSGYGSDAVAYGCRAWVNFNGTSTVAIRASGNVTSITDNGTGDYTVNLTTAMPDANYSISSLCGYNTGVTEAAFVTLNTTTIPTTTAYRIKTRDTSSSLFDSTYVLSSIFR